MSKECDPTSSALLEITRPMMIVAALYCRRQSLMARPEWSAASIGKINGNLQHSSGSTLEPLLDAMAQLPSLYRERDKLVPKLPPNSFTRDTNNMSSLYPLTEIQSLLDRSLCFRDHLYTLGIQWKVQHQELSFPHAHCAAIYSKDPYPCSVVKHFSSLQAANAFTLYNALVILINQFVISLYLLVPVSTLEVKAEEFAREKISAAIIDIIKSIHYHLSHTESSVTAAEIASGSQNNYLLFPIRVAQQAISQCYSSREMAKRLWLDNVLDIIKSRGGPWMSNNQLFGAGESNNYHESDN
jgi:competence protein ComGC